MSKYHTPTIEEFHVGFEFEYERNGVWYEDITNDLYECYDIWKDHEADRHPVRVKYLDQEDIESLGFNLVETEPHDLYSREVDKDHTWLLVPHYFEEGCELRVWVVSKSSVIKGGEFDGTIKNKSELIMVLKMIGYETN